MAVGATNEKSDSGLDIEKLLKYLGLWKFAGVMMYVLHEVLGLPEEKMIAPLDEKRGKLLLEDILNGGNFATSDSTLPSMGISHNREW